MTERSYEIILVPADASGKFLFGGKDYTLVAQRHNVKVFGIDYYVRENATGSNSAVQEIVEENLERLVKSVDPVEFRLLKPLIIKLSLESEEI